MKIRQRANSNSSRAVNPNKNHSKKNFLVVIVLVITALLIVWVYTMGAYAIRPYGYIGRCIVGANRIRPI